MRAEAGDGHMARPERGTGRPSQRGGERARGAGAFRRPQGGRYWSVPGAVPPPHDLYWLEPGRAACELAAACALWPLLQVGAPRGDGHPVLALPGVVGTDFSTLPLRMHLAGLGHAVHGWGLGFNLGPQRGVIDALRRLLESLHSADGRTVSLVGWSLGGIYARLLAVERPDLVRCVITLGTPLVGGASGTHADAFYRWLSGDPPFDWRAARTARQAADVPSTSIYSRSDGIVSWRSSVQPAGRLAENIEVVGSHVGLAANPAVLYAVADRLAQPEGRWQPFERRGWRLLAYPDPQRPAET